MNSGFLYWGAVLIGVLVARILNYALHAHFGMYQGVPLGRLGTGGTILQVALMALPFLLAPVLVGIFYYRKTGQRPPKSEVVKQINFVAVTAVLLYAFFWIGTGALFGLIQGTPLIIFTILIVVPCCVVLAFAILFPLTATILARLLGADHKTG